MSTKQRKKAPSEPKPRVYWKVCATQKIRRKGSTKLEPVRASAFINTPSCRRIYDLETRTYPIPGTGLLAFRRLKDARAWCQRSEVIVKGLGVPGPALPRRRFRGNAEMQYVKPVKDLWAGHEDPLEDYPLVASEARRVFGRFGSPYADDWPEGTVSLAWCESKGVVE